MTVGPGIKGTGNLESLEKRVFDFQTVPPLQVSGVKLNVRSPFVLFSVEFNQEIVEKTSDIESLVFQFHG